MLDEYVPRIRRCVELLGPEEIWKKPSPHGNSVGSLLLHLAGNTRQWILSGIDGAADLRDRDAEFAATDSDASPGELMDRLEETVREAVAVVEGMTADDFVREREFQGGRFRGDGAGGVLHVLEHFSGHAGQIYAWTKQLRGVDLKFYDL